MMIKIKEFLKEFSLINLFKNNWQIKLISILLAFVLWFVICEYVDPETTTWASDINISVNYEGSVPQKENLGIMTIVDQKVDVCVSGSRDTIALMNRQKITATLDLSNVTKSGEYDLPVLIDLGNQNITKVEQSIETVKVQFDTLKVSNIKVNVNIKGDVPEGLIREEPTIDSGDYLVVTGPTAIIDTIVSAEAEIKQESFKQTGTFECDYVFIDKDGAIYIQILNNGNEAQSAPIPEKFKRSKSVLKQQEVYIVAKDWSWTFVSTHENGWLGPYFYAVKNG